MLNKFYQVQLSAMTPHVRDFPACEHYVGVGNRGMGGGICGGNTIKGDYNWREG